MKMLPVYAKERACLHGKPVPAIIYYATPQNPNYTGDQGEEKIAKVISRSFGESGHNMEYLFRLADFMRERLPNEAEPHLYMLDSLVRNKAGLCTSVPLPWKQLMQCDRFSRRIVGNVRCLSVGEKDENESQRDAKREMVKVS